VKFWRADGGRVSVTCGRKAKQLVADPDIQQQLRIALLLQGSEHMEEPEKEM
jgi:hypothetical protein